MPDIKAIFLDIDGTLVSFNTHEVPQSTIEALHKVRAMGVKIFIATGRPQPFVDNLGTLQYDGIMTVNGASCKTVDGEIITHNPILRDDLFRLIEYYKDHPFPIAFASDDDTFITGTNEESKHILEILNIPCPVVKPIEECLQMDVMQIISFFPPEEEEFLMQNIFKGCATQRWHPFFADVIRAGSDKSKGIDAIAQYYGIPLSQIMAFGDGGNDISMLKHVGYGIAMGNAKDIVKASARYVTDGVDENGIFNALNRFFHLE